MIADLIALLFLITVVYVLVRPQSAGPDLIGQLGQALAAMVRSVTT